MWNVFTITIVIIFIVVGFSVQVCTLHNTRRGKLTANGEKTCLRSLTHWLPIIFSCLWLQAILGILCLWLFIALVNIPRPKKTLIRRGYWRRVEWENIFKSNSFPSNVLQSESVSYVFPTATSTWRKMNGKLPFWMPTFSFEIHLANSYFGCIPFTCCEWRHCSFRMSAHIPQWITIAFAAQTMSTQRTHSMQNFLYSIHEYDRCDGGGDCPLCVSNSSQSLSVYSPWENMWVWLWILRIATQTHSSHVTFNDAEQTTNTRCELDSNRTAEKKGNVEGNV